ncbi:MAG: DUF177 domain-containing protein [Bifidobacterium sp.]|jgi:uncharacterized protein|nr:DUF177 domain-containing protein [Bifidobacterium sp.]
MSRPEDSPWAIPVAQLSSRAGQHRDVDAQFPAPDGIGDAVVGVGEGAGLHVEGSFDSIVDGLIFQARVTAPLHAECTRCLTPIRRDWNVQTTAFFPYAPRHAGAVHHNARAAAEEDVEIVAGEEESEDSYPLSPDGAFADIQALLRDALAEHLPLQLLCRANCRGLCPQCGLNLNEHPEHRHDITDIRFASLAGLKAQLEKEQQ